MVNVHCFKLLRCRELLDSLRLLIYGKMGQGWRHINLAQGGASHCPSPRMRLRGHPQAPPETPLSRAVIQPGSLDQSRQWGQRDGSLAGKAVKEERGQLWASQHPFCVNWRVASPGPWLPVPGTVPVAKDREAPAGRLRVGQAWGPFCHRIPATGPRSGTAGWGKGGDKRTESPEDKFQPFLRVSGSWGWNDD